MERDAIISILRQQERELRAAGIVSLALIGSTARSEGLADSDIDLLAAFDELMRLSLLDVVHLEHRLSDLLGQKVDLVEVGTLRPRVRERVERDLVCAF